MTDVDACVAAGAEVMARGAMRVLVVHFPRGAIAFERDGTVTRRASVDAPPAEVRGANGAGDAFAAGMMYGLHEGWDDRPRRSRSPTPRRRHRCARSRRPTASSTGAAASPSRTRWGWRPPI